MSRTCTSLVSPCGLWLRLAVALITVTPSHPFAQPADHPANKPIQVGTDFGIAPFVFRSPAGPEGFSVDMIREIARRIKRSRPMANIIRPLRSALPRFPCSS